MGLFRVTPQGGGEGIYSSISHQLTGFWATQGKVGWGVIRGIQCMQGGGGVVTLPWAIRHQVSVWGWFMFIGGGFCGGIQFMLGEGGVVILPWVGGCCRWCCPYTHFVLLPSSHSFMVYQKRGSFWIPLFGQWRGGGLWGQSFWWLWFLGYLVPGEYLVCLVHVGWEQRLVSLLWTIGHRVSVRGVCSCLGLLHLVYVGKLSFCPFSGQPLLVIPPWAIIFL